MIESIKDLFHLITAFLKEKYLHSGSIDEAIDSGTLAVYTVVLTIQWLRDRIRQLLSKEEIAKVAVAKIEVLIKELPDNRLFSELYDEGYDMIIASVNENGKIEDIEAVKDESDGDMEIDELLGDEQMVVITK